MDPRFRLQPGMVMNPSGAIPLRPASGFTPSLSSGQGFHTVESLQGVSVVPDGMVGYTPSSGYDPARGLGGRAVGVGQLGYDAAPLGVQQRVGQPAGMQQLVPASPSAGFSSLMPAGYSVPVEVAGTPGRIPPGIPKQPPMYVYQTYVQPEPPRAPVRYVAQPSMVPAVDAGLQMREYEHMRLREDERQQERNWKITRMRERKLEWAQERRRNIEMRREFERDRELDRRRAFERRQEIDYEERVRERFQRKVKGPIRRGVPQPPAFTIRQFDYRDEMKSKGPPVYVPRKIRCALCQIECNSQEMLGKHLAGKKHQARVKAEEDKKNPEQVDNVEADEEKLPETDNHIQQEGVEPTMVTMETDGSKGKGKAKTKRKKIWKAQLPVSNADPSQAEVQSMDVIVETAQDPDKVQAAAIKPATIEVAIEVDKDEAMATDIGPGEGPLDADLESANKEPNVGAIKVEQETATVTLVASDNKAGGLELLKEVTLVTGKTILEVEPTSAKTTRQLKTKTAGASPVVDADAVRCETCKVTCRNISVYETHLKGPKHAERVKKAQGQTPSGKNTKDTDLVHSDVALTPAPATGESGVGMNGLPNATAELT